MAATFSSQQRLSGHDTGSEDARQRIVARINAIKQRYQDREAGAEASPIAAPKARSSSRSKSRSPSPDRNDGPGASSSSRQPTSLAEATPTGAPAPTQACDVACCAFVHSCVWNRRPCCLVCHICVVVLFGSCASSCRCSCACVERYFVCPSLVDTRAHWSCQSCNAGHPRPSRHPCWPHVAGANAVVVVGLRAASGHGAVPSGQGGPQLAQL